MSRFRSHWLALLGGVALLALSMSSVLGNSPASGDPNRGQQVSTFVHELLAGEEQTDENSDENEDSNEDANEDDQADDQGAGQPDNHGACVSKVAMNLDEVGPPNDNHGGAVSEAARVTCWEEQSGDGGAGGESAPAGPGRGHGHGHGGKH
jgi:hypothetical protein